MKEWINVGLVIFALAAAALIPIGVRTLAMDGLLIGTEPYAAINAASHPSISYSGLLWVASRFGLLAIAVRIIPIVCLLAAGILLYSLLRRSKMEERPSLIALALFCAAPAALSAMLQFGDAALSFLLALIAIWLFIHRLWPLSILPLLILAISSPPTALLSCLAILLISPAVQRPAKGFTVTLPALMLVLLAGNIFVSKGGNLDFIADLGSTIGISVFTLALGIGGIVICWKRRSALAPLYLFLVLTILSFRLWPTADMLFFSAAIAIFGAFSIERLLSMKWQLDLVKSLTMLTIACGVLFSVIIGLDIFAQSPPTPPMVQSLLALRLMPEGKVLTYPDYQPWVQSFSEKETIPSSATVQQAFHSDDIVITQRLLHELDARYLWIEPGMRSGLVWSKPDEGLLFMLRNDQIFKRTYSLEGLDIYVINLSDVTSP